MTICPNCDWLHLELAGRGGGIETFVHESSPPRVRADLGDLDALGWVRLRGPNSLADIIGPDGEFDRDLWAVTPASHSILERP